jgi:hypothetical protein
MPTVARTTDMVLAAFSPGAGGRTAGPPELWFYRALLTGRLLPPAQRRELLAAIPVDDQGMPFPGGEGALLSLVIMLLDVRPAGPIRRLG